MPNMLKYHNDGLLGFLDTWTTEYQEKPGHSNTLLAKMMNEIKKEIIPFYFDRPSSHLSNGPELWFDDVTQAYINILAGNDMQETRSILTGMSTSIEDVSYFGEAATTVTVVERNIHESYLRPQKYVIFETTMQNLNSTSCLNLAICHQIRVKVGMEILT